MRHTKNNHFVLKVIDLVLYLYRGQKTVRGGGGKRTGF
jgi:hypothetical protein